jgi:hypothetical protein
MRDIRKLVLLAVMALAATAIAAPAALAQSNPENHETLELRNKATGAHCPAVTKPTAHTVAGGCFTHTKSQGEWEFRKHVFGIESHFTSCEVEFYERLNEDGEGYMLHQSFSHPSCVRRPCQEPSPETEPTPWPAHLDELHKPGVNGETGLTSPIGGHTEILTFNFCVEPIGGGTDETCEIDVAFNQTATPSQYEGGGAGSEMASHGISGFRCEIVGHYITEHIPVGQQGREENLVGGQQEGEITITHLLNENKAENP